MPPELVRAFAAIVARTERLPRQRLRDYQLSLLAKLLAHARETTQFYRDRIDFDIQKTSEIRRRWSEIPVLKRAEVAETPETLLSRFSPPEAVPVNSGQT